MKAALYAAIAVTLYSFMNVALEQKLAKYNASAVLILCYTVMFPLAIARWGQLRITDGPIAFPVGTLLVLTLAFGAVYFFADFFYISAFTAASGSVMTVTTILMLTPVTSSIVKYFYTGGTLPNSYQVAGYILAVAAVYLVSKGSQ